MNPSNPKIKILHLEDMRADAELTSRQLTKANIEFDALVVYERNDYITALTEFNPDLILADHSMPSFNSMEALHIMQQSGLKIPFVVLTGSLRREHAMELVKEGADDYVLKDHASRLPAVILEVLEKHRAAKHKKQQLSEHELLASIVNFSDDAIISKTIDGIISSWNQSAETLFGYPANEVVGKHISIIIPGAQSNTEQERAGRIKKGERLQHYETVRITKDGQLMDVSISISPIKDKEGNMVGTSQILRNITECRRARLGMSDLNEMLELKVAERTIELQEANSALEAFSYSVSHDLRAPVRAISSFSKIIRKEHHPSLNPEVLGLLEHIESNSKRMGVIIDDLLALARYTRQEPKLLPADMRHLFKTVWNNLQFSFPHNAELELAELPTVHADVSMLEQVVVNLLSNAVKYSSKKERPVVTVGYEIVDGRSIFSVSDNGVGFDMEHYNRLFGVFERLHNTTDFEGTGVGLFLVRKIIEKHGGTVWAKGTVNEGAVFYFALPDKINNN